MVWATALGCAVDDRVFSVGDTDASIAANRPDPGLAEACSPGGTRCASPTEAVECGADGLWGAPLPCDGPCVNGRCGGECAPSSAECLSVTRVRRCSDAGVWGDPEECEFACVAGGCGGLCKPSQTRCASELEVEVCSAEGQWAAPAPCAEGCVGDACIGECDSGDGRCASSTQAQTCSELEQWQAPVSCLNACTDGACGGSCIPNATRCASSTAVERCSEAGEWGEPSECPNACLGSACGGECRPGAGRCNAATGLPQVCTVEGAWQDEAACPFVCTGEGSCGGVCVPDSRRCDPVTGLPQRCEGGAWLDEPACSFVCTDGTCGGECRPGDGRCQNGLPQACSAAGVWTQQPACQFTCTGAGSCSGECMDGERRCNPISGVPQLCSGGIWQNQAGCPFVCAAGSCTGECSPSSTRCNPTSGVPQLCSGGGLWQDQGACPFVCSNGVCGGECAPGSRRCNAQTGLPQLCSGSGTYQNQTPCRSGEVCVGSGNNTSCVCQNNLTACTGGCFDLSTDPNNCGSCGHSCQGQSCSAGRCNPTTITRDRLVTSRLALNTSELFFATNQGDLYRITKEGAGLRALVIGSALRGAALDGTTVYWALASNPDRIERVSGSGNGNLVTFASASDGLGALSYRSVIDAAAAGGAMTNDAVAISNGFVYWATASAYRRAPVTAALPAAGELLGSGGDFSVTALMAPAGACVYGVSTSWGGIIRACTAGRQATVYEGNFIMDIVADASAVYFTEHSIGVKRMALDSDSPAITTLVPTSGVPLSVTTDQNFVYFIDGAVTAALCAPNMSIKRVPKSGGEVVTLVQFDDATCPKVISVDDTFLYFASWEIPGTDGTISRVAK